MRFPTLLVSAALRRFSASASASASSINRNLRHVPYYHRENTFLQAKEAVAEYFYSTRSFPLYYAEQIAANSPNSLFSLLSGLQFSSRSDFPRDIRRYLAYRPINEFDFFFESIGVPPDRHPYHGIEGAMFLSDESRLVQAVFALIQFGFPWAKLGVLYNEESSIFGRSGEELRGKLAELERFELDKVCLIGICLAFPSVLARSDAEVDLLFRDLKWVLRDLDSTGSIEENVEAYFRFCRVVRVFYNADCKKGEMGELMKGCWKEFMRFEEQDFVNKLNFLGRLGMRKDEAGTLLLQHPQIMELDLENMEISMLDYLGRCGFSKEELNTMLTKYSYVMGKNKLGNLPESLRALGLREWLLCKISNGEFHHLSPDYLEVPKGDEEMDGVFQDKLQCVKATRVKSLLLPKLEFLQGIGFGKNVITLRALRLLMGTRTHLKERFDCLLSMGIEYSTLCRMISVHPKILNQSPEMLHVKVNFLCSELGLTVQYLSKFPSYLSFDLENRIKPRYKMLDWLRNKGLLNKCYSPSTVISTSEKQYIVYLLNIHPAAPKIWLEVFKFNNHQLYQFTFFFQ